MGQKEKNPIIIDNDPNGTGLLLMVVGAIALLTSTTCLCLQPWVIDYIFYNAPRLLGLQ